MMKELTKFKSRLTSGSKGYSAFVRETSQNYVLQ